MPRNALAALFLVALANPVCGQASCSGYVGPQVSISVGRLLVVAGTQSHLRYGTMLAIGLSAGTGGPFRVPPGMQLCWPFQNACVDVLPDYYTSGVPGHSLSVSYPPAYAGSTLHASVVGFNLSNTSVPAGCVHISPLVRFTLR